MTGLRLLVTSILVALGAAGCGNTAGGGGQSPMGPTNSGRPAGTPCYPVSYNQGCLTDAKGHLRMTCDEATQAWVETAQCPTGQVCVEEADPTDTSGVKKLTKCETPAAPATDAGTTDGGGTNQGDGSAQADGGATKTDGGGSVTLGEWLTCAKGKCSSQWAACAAVAACKSGAECVDKCSGDKTCEQACMNAVGEDGSGLTTLMLCADEMDCGSGTTKPACGNGICDKGENPETCAKDCKPTGPECGNGTCEEGENVETCSQDCKATGPVCGNGKCESGETPASCAKDCGLPSAVCGDGKCEGSETSSSCAKDCGGSSGADSCVGKCGKFVEGAKCQCDDKCAQYKDCCNDYTKTCGGSGGPKCGDGKCDAGESKATCPVDCGGSSGGGYYACLMSKCASDFSKCQSNSGCAGIVLYLAAGDCVQASGCGAQDAACQQSKCGAQFTACQSNSGCGAFAQCVNKCGANDGACQQKCMTPGGNQIMSLLSCGQTNKCQ